jgi:uncharacterized membrane protein YcaP (DUF421 family)
MEQFFADLLGLHETATTIAYGQIMWRTGSVFIVALVLLRISGRRTFASNSALDMIVKFMAGAILSRAIMAESPYLLTLTAATTLILLHRVLAYVTFFFPALGRLLRGSPSILAEGTTVNYHELRRASLTEADMMASVHSTSNLEDLTQTKVVRLEHDGMVSVIKKEPS